MAENAQNTVRVSSEFSAESVGAFIELLMAMEVGSKGSALRMSVNKSEKPAWIAKACGIAHRLVPMILT